jgi:hypothetical protein
LVCNLVCGPDFDRIPFVVSSFVTVGISATVRPGLDFVPVTDPIKRVFVDLTGLDRISFVVSLGQEAFVVSTTEDS